MNNYKLENYKWNQGQARRIANNQVDIAIVVVVVSLYLIVIPPIY